MFVRVLFNCVDWYMRIVTFNIRKVEGVNIQFVPSDLCTLNPAIVALS